MSTDIQTDPNDLPGHDTASMGIKFKYPLLKLGSKGLAVTRLQRALGINPDGDYGPKTVAAVRQFQQDSGLVIDGAAGQKTQDILYKSKNDEEKFEKIVSESKYLTEVDLIAAAGKLGVSLAAVKAINKVESSGVGFFKQNSHPVILFERHWMYRLLAKNDKAVADRLANKNPSVINPARGGYSGGTKEIFRMVKAGELAPANGSESCSLQSASWGLFQIMGFHWKRLGYKSVQEMVAEMNHSEGKQLGAFVRFILSDKILHAALKKNDWAKVAEIYNGPANVPVYSGRLNSWFNQFTKVLA